MKILIFIKRLFCKHLYVRDYCYLLNGKNEKIVCAKCGKIKEYILVEKRPTIAEIKELALNKGWNVE